MALEEGVFCRVPLFFETTSALQISILSLVSKYAV